MRLHGIQIVTHQEMIFFLAEGFDLQLAVFEQTLQKVTVQRRVRPVW